MIISNYKFQTAQVGAKPIIKHKHLKEDFLFFLNTQATQCYGQYKLSNKIIMDPVLCFFICICRT